MSMKKEHFNMGISIGQLINRREFKTEIIPPEHSIKQANDYLNCNYPGKRLILVDEDNPNRRKPRRRQ